LTSLEDKQIFVDKCLNLKDKLEDKQALITKNDVPNPNELYFCNYVKFEPEYPEYIEATHMENLKTTLETIIEQYNKHGKAPMNLLLFEYFL
jgi:hypothetical protein